MRVFLSSTKADLEDFREAVFAAISQKHAVMRMEDFPSGGLPPLEFCLSQVDDAEAVVLLIGYRYGTRAHEAGVSYTEAEYERAQLMGIPVFAYIRAEFDTGIELGGQPSADRDSLRAFREIVEADQVVRRPFFRTPEELADQVSADLTYWEKHRTLRPAFGRRAGLIRDPRRYGRGATRRAALRILPFPVTLVNLATMDLERYPDNHGGRLVNKLIDIEADLREKDVQAGIFNNLELLTTNDRPILEQRLAYASRVSAAIVCFSKTSQDIDRLADFAPVQEKLVVWHAAGTQIPAGITPLYAQPYTQEDLHNCLLRVEAASHIFDLATQRLLQEMSA